jgi:hypothetical protein
MISTSFGISFWVNSTRGDGHPPEDRAEHKPEEEVESRPDPAAGNVEEVECPTRVRADRGDQGRDDDPNDRQHLDRQDLDRRLPFRALRRSSSNGVLDGYHWRDTIRRAGAGQDLKLESRSGA